MLGLKTIFPRLKNSTGIFLPAPVHGDFFGKELLIVKSRRQSSGLVLLDLAVALADIVEYSPSTEPLTTLADMIAVQKMALTPSF